MTVYYAIRRGISSYKKATSKVIEVFWKTEIFSDAKLYRPQLNMGQR